MPSIFCDNDFYDDAELRALDRRLGANVYAVQNLRREVRGVRLSREIAEAEATKVLGRVSKRFVTRHQFRHTPPGRRLLPNMQTIEKLATQPHINILIKRPPQISFEALKQVLEAEWLASPWAESNDAAFWIEEREPGSDVVAYICKEGRNSVLEKPWTFPSE